MLSLPPRSGTNTPVCSTANVPFESSIYLEVCLSPRQAFETQKKMYKKPHSPPSTLLGRPREAHKRSTAGKAIISHRQLCRHQRGGGRWGVRSMSHRCPIAELFLDKVGDLLRNARPEHIGTTLYRRFLTQFTHPKPRLRTALATRKSTGRCRDMTGFPLGANRQHRGNSATPTPPPLLYNLLPHPDKPLQTPTAKAQSN